MKNKHRIKIGDGHDFMHFLPLARKGGGRCQTYIINERIVKSVDLMTPCFSLNETGGRIRVGIMHFTLAGNLEEDGRAFLHVSGIIKGTKNGKSDSEV